MSVEKVTREVYFSPRRRRAFFTAKAAARAEANARMRTMFPPARSVYDDHGRCEEPGWSFHEVPRLVSVRDRLIERYLKALR